MDTTNTISAAAELEGFYYPSPGTPPDFLLIKKPEGEKDLVKWINDNKEEFDNMLHTNGAILFRGFRVNTVSKFEKVSDIFKSETREYKFRSSPRFTVGKNVYTSTSYPKESVINMHSEASYTPYRDVQCVIFCCIQPPSVGGETPIADNRMILQNLSEETRKKFQEKGVMYMRNLDKNAGLPWQEVFQTTDRKVVEAECEETGMTYTWKDDDNLQMTWVKKAIWEHPFKKEQTWYNHAFFYNKYTFESEFGATELSDRLPYNSYFGDGSEISKEEMEELTMAYKKATIQFTWKKGDVLFLDNLLVSHGRNAYDGKRKILASLF
ncbi:TauD/TfdA family dioxygenase [Roseivirga sp. BDSF3-8]|uniref:TauD/TfdA family dioxygenase n=1 Tax=Roseivirga sp. BDSF3-8 TaxID=3241598 RepID=UPI0035320DA6